uniref:F-box domain-containing protein n=1 Tax=Nelumbo nucifera TaxID=4432 RepID=A0A822ZXV3_NELNU|nr:TPA_asm: hypothetical protein HUJ06_017946 [Nelumbo nucifera]
MENCYDFISWLGRDVSSTILKFLEDPADLVRVSAVSRSWRQFVIEYGFCKKLCARLFPAVSRIIRVVEGNGIMDHIEIGSNNSKEWENLERDHRVYGLLARGLMSFIRRDCISEAISASSTDNYPEESIQNTLEPNDRVDQRASYWSSKGESNPAVSETLTYKLISKLCVITEVSVQPFQAFFQFGFPIYSATAVRFRMGHLNPPEAENVHMDRLREDQKPSGDQFVWTYVSPEFPMAQVKL